VNTPIELSPFGFTPTESAVYGRLLEGGPAGGYSVSRELLIARANVYQALRGLVAKGAAVAITGTPQRFRAVRPSDLYARIVQQESDKLDQLEAQIAVTPQRGAASYIPVLGERAYLEMAGRSIARERSGVELALPATMLAALVPVLRKRLADATPTTIWVVGELQNVSLPIAGTISLERARQFFDGAVAMVILEQSVLVGRVEAGTISGYWSSEPSIVGATRACLATLTAIQS
jgi:sugar-specific transcriptional regulator TrmB